VMSTTTQDVYSPFAICSENERIEFKSAANILNLRLILASTGTEGLMSCKLLKTLPFLI
jgi:hypothetical protein